MFKSAKKSLGQNFLIDQNIQKKIVNSLSCKEKDQLIFEIGPGRGALTEHLLELNKELILVEFDSDLAEYWKNKKLDNVKIFNSDILNIDLTKLHINHNNKLIHVIGNIPYNITSPILFHLFDHRTVISEAVIMMQKEVAERIVASPNSKEYGILSVQSQFFSNVKKLFNVPSSVFKPRPNVDSTVLHFDFNKEINPEIDLTFFKNIVRTSFNHRRKMLRSTLKGFSEDLSLIDFDFTKRPEDLSVEDFIFLTSKLK